MHTSFLLQKLYLVDAYHLVCPLEKVADPVQPQQAFAHVPPALLLA